MEPDDGLQANYERLAAATLLRAIRDLQDCGYYAKGARRWLCGPEAETLAAGLGLDLCALQAWVQNQKTANHVTGRE